MMFENDLQKMGRHLVNILDQNREVIRASDDSTVFSKVVYGEPKVIESWPLCSIQPLRKLRELKSTHKYAIEFQIELFLYWGSVDSTLEVQESLHKKAEALENFIDNDRHWNFTDPADHDKDKVIYGYSAELDHPVLLTTNELWSASRLRLTAISEEIFRA